MLLNHRVDASNFLCDESTSLRCCVLIFNLLCRQDVRPFPDLPRRPHPLTGTGPSARLYFPADSNATRGTTNTDDTSSIDETTDPVPPQLIDFGVHFNLKMPDIQRLLKQTAHLPHCESGQMCS